MYKRNILNAVVVSLLLLSVLLPAAASATGPDDLPLDYNAVFSTRVPHLNASNGGGGGGQSGTTSPSASFGGSPYSVDAIVPPTTTVPEAEEHIAVDPTNASYLVAAVSDFGIRGGSNTTKYAVSTDGGMNGSWVESYVPRDDTGQLLVTRDGRVWPYNSDPVVAIDNSGNVFLANLYFNSGGGNNSNGLYVGVGTVSAGSITANTTYPVAVNPSPTTSIFEDKEWIAVDNSSNADTTGNVYVSWTRFAGNSNYIVVSRSTDQGVTWSAPVQVSLASQNGAVQGSQVAVGPDGAVYVVYEAYYIGGKRAQFMAKSTDEGVTFSTATAITPKFNELSFNSTYRKSSFPSLAVSPATGYVYVVYAAQAGKNSQVQFIRSTAPGGTTFSSPVAINDQAAGQRLMPAIAVDESGVLHASWFDTRNSSRSSAYYDIYATFSNDNGLTFAPNARVTPALNSAGRTTFIGDYSGIAAAGGFAHPAWTSGGLNGGSLGRLQTATLSLP